MEIVYLGTGPKLWLVRSDQGDGGWSLHTKAAMKAACDAGDVPETLHSGPSDIDPETEEWVRPSSADIDAAYRLMNAE